MTTTTTAALTINTSVRIFKGCDGRGIRKNEKARVVEVKVGERNSASVLLEFGSGRRVRFYVQHVNRLSDYEVGMNDGNPCHRIVVRRA